MRYQNTELSEVRFHAVMGNGAREVRLEWGTGKHLVEVVLSNIQRLAVERRSVRRVMSSSCSQPSPTKE
jgi:hypothetical protein